MLQIIFYSYRFVFITFRWQILANSEKVVKTTRTTVMNVVKELDQRVFCQGGKKG